MNGSAAETSGGAAGSGVLDPAGPAGPVDPAGPAGSVTAQASSQESWRHMSGRAGAGWVARPISMRSTATAAAVAARVGSTLANVAVGRVAAAVSPTAANTARPAM